MKYHLIAEDVRSRIVAETKAKLSARRAFLETVVSDADAAMSKLDNERFSHFLAKHAAEAELRDLANTEAQI